MSGQLIATKSFSVGRFTATVSLPPGGDGVASVEWSPRVPDIARDFSSKQRVEYQRKLVETLAGVGP